MALHFCKKCGTVYDDRNGACPKCETKDVVDAVYTNTYVPPQSEMTPEEISAARKKSWIQLVIGIPCFIGFIYLLCFIFVQIKGG